MNPQLAKHGRSFKGAAAYYLHDKNAETQDRIAWTETRNTITRDARKAALVMAYTAKHQDRLKEAAGKSRAGRKDTKPVMAYSLSWHPDHDPSREHMTEMALKSMKALGVEEHEAIIVAHRDTPHRHVHVIVNRIHPITGMIASDSHILRKLSDFARIYQKKHNMNYCPKREENYKKRKQGKSTKYRDPKIQEAWDNSDNGKSFIAALVSNGYHLAKGNKRLVVIDKYGKTHNPVRHIEGIKTKDLNTRLKDIDRESLPDATELAREVQSKHEENKRLYVSNNDRFKSDFNKTAKKKIKPLRQEFQKQTNQLSNSFKGVAEQSEATPQTSQPSKNENTEQGQKTEQALATRLRILQDRHLRERAALSDHFHRRIEREKDKLEHTYKLKDQLNQIWNLQKKCEKHGFWDKLTGKAKREREYLKVAKLNFKDAKMRYDEQVQGLKSEYAHQVENLKRQQKEEIDHHNKLSQKQSFAPKNLSTHRINGQYRRPGINFF